MAVVVASIGVVSLNDQMGMMINTIGIHGPQSKAAYLETKTNPKTEKTAHHHHRLVSNTFHTFETSHPFLNNLSTSFCEHNNTNQQ